jgi:uncharacterized protein YecE (DUF72 family)
MKFFVGTSGFSYKEWKGSFYPEKHPQKQMLSYYAQHFSAVEMNNTHYRMPTSALLESWANEVPPNFRFALKAPQVITHFKRLKEVDEPTAQFLSVASVLKGKLGPLLFQLPPNFKKDVPRLESFLSLLKAGPLTAFEFRNQTWFDDEVFECLRAKSCALCMDDADYVKTDELAGTASWGYLRLRRESYSTKELAAWIEKIRSQNWGEVYVFFKHEDTGTGPKLAARFIEQAESSSG